MNTIDILIILFIFCLGLYLLVNSILTSSELKTKKCLALAVCSSNRIIQALSFVLVLAPLFMLTCHLRCQCLDSKKTYFNLFVMFLVICGPALIYLGIDIRNHAEKIAKLSGATGATGDIGATDMSSLCPKLLQYSKRVRSETILLITLATRSNDERNLH